MIAWIQWLYKVKNINSYFICQFEIEGKTVKRKERNWEQEEKRERKKKESRKEIKEKIEGECEKREKKMKKKSIQIKKSRMKKTLKRGIARKHYKKWIWADRLISSELAGNIFMKFKQL